MNDNLLIETKEIGDYRIKIYYDECPSCPVTDWDMGAKHLFEYLEHRGYQLSSNCDWEEYNGGHSIRDNSLSDLLQRIAADVVKQKDIINYIKAGKVDDVRLIYNRKERQWELQWQCNYGSQNGKWVSQYEIEPSELKNHDFRMELLEPLDEDDLFALIKECAKDFVIKEWSSCRYSQGDHMRGVSYMTKEMFDERCGFSPDHYKTWQEQALSVIDDEVSCIEKWAWGDVKGYILEKKVPFTKVYDDENREDVDDIEWEEVGSCWGFYLKTEELIDEVIAEYDLKEVA